MTPYQNLTSLPNAALSRDHALPARPQMPSLHRQPGRAYIGRLEPSTEDERTIFGNIPISCSVGPRVARGERLDGSMKLSRARSNVSLLPSLQIRTAKAKVEHESLRLRYEPQARRSNGGSSRHCERCCDSRMPDARQSPLRPRRLRRV
jgi:hypothetical protein